MILNPSFVHYNSYVPTILCQISLGVLLAILYKFRMWKSESPCGYFIFPWLIFFSHIRLINRNLVIRFHPWVMHTPLHPFSFSHVSLKRGPPKPPRPLATPWPFRNKKHNPVILKPRYLLSGNPITHAHALRYGSTSLLRSFVDHDVTHSTCDWTMSKSSLAAYPYLANARHPHIILQSCDSHNKFLFAISKFLGFITRSVWNFVILRIARKTCRFRDLLAASGSSHIVPSCNLAMHLKALLICRQYGLPYRFN